MQQPFATAMLANLAPSCNAELRVQNESGQQRILQQFHGIQYFSQRVTLKILQQRSDAMVLYWST